MQSPDYRAALPRQERKKEELSFEHCQSMDEIFDVLRRMNELHKRLRGDNNQVYTFDQLTRLITAIEGAVAQQRKGGDAVSMPAIEKVLQDNRVPENGGLRRGLLAALTADFGRSTNTPNRSNDGPRNERFSKRAQQYEVAPEQEPPLPFTPEWLDQLSPTATERVLLQQIEDRLGVTMAEIQRGCRLQNITTNDVVTTWIGRAPNGRMLYAFNGGRTPTAFNVPTLFLTDILRHHVRADTTPRRNTRIAA